MFSTNLKKCQQANQAASKKSKRSVRTPGETQKIIISSRGTVGTPPRDTKSHHLFMKAPKTITSSRGSVRTPCETPKIFTSTRGPVRTTIRVPNLLAPGSDSDIQMHVSWGTRLRTTDENIQSVQSEMLRTPQNVPV